MNRTSPIWIALLLVLLPAPPAGGEEAAPSGRQPYIDLLKNKLAEESEAEESSGTSYSEELKRELQDDASAQSGGYSQYLRKKVGTQTLTEESEGYSARMKRKLDAEEGEDRSTIEAVNRGESTLKAEKKGEITGALGFRVGASVTPGLTAASGAGAQSFGQVYGSGWTPDVTLFYEYQPFHSEWAGSVGLLASLGLSAHKGRGVFQFDLVKPWDTSTSFGSESGTTFRFFTVPLSVEAIYRFNLMRFVRPYVSAGPTLIGYVETREDSKKGQRGNSRGIRLSAGVAILLDWVDPQTSWDLFMDAGVHHYYLTIEYNRLHSFSGDVEFRTSGIYAGLAYEY